MLYCTGYCTVRLAASANFLKIAPAPQKVSFLKKSLTKTVFRLLQAYPFCWAYLQNNRASNPPQNNQHFPAARQRKSKALAARIVSKPAAFQHPYCAVLYWVLYRQARRRRRFSQNRTCPPEGQFSKEIFNKSSFFRLLQGYPFCWACLQNKRASKPPQNNQHFSARLPKDN